MHRLAGHDMKDDSNRLERRKFLGCIGLAGIVATAGCSGGNQEETTTDEGGAETTQPDDSTGDSTAVSNDMRGGEARVTVSRTAENLNPILHVNAPEYMTTSWMYSKLTQVDTNLEVHPDLATDWEANDDVTQWTFHLRDDATFHHNGEQVTAEDVKATLETIQDEDIGSPGQGAIGPIESVDVVDETTAQVNMSGPYADLPKMVGSQYCGIVPADVIENDFDSLATTDYGSGPFILEEFEIGSHSILSRNDDYYLQDENGNQLPYLDGITQNVYPEEAAELSALESQQADITLEVSSSSWSRVQNMNGVNPHRTAGGTFANVVMRSDEPPFDDNRVREAFKLAIDRETLLEGAVNGLGTIAQDSPISPAYEYHTELPERERDLERARELLDEAGYGDGLELTLYAADSPAVRVDTAVLYKEQLAEIGVDVEVQQVSYDRYLSEIWTQATFYVGYYGLRYAEDGILYLLLHSDGSWNEAHWSDEEFDQALEEARQVTDPERRQELYGRAQEILYERGPFLIPFFMDRLGASRDYVNNYKLDPTGFFVHLQDVSLSDNAPTK